MKITIEIANGKTRKITVPKDIVRAVADSVATLQGWKVWYRLNGCDHFGRPDEEGVCWVQKGHADYFPCQKT